MPIINWAQIILKTVQTPKVKSITLARARSIVEEAQQAMIEEFDENPITQELEDETKDGSDFLPGGYGNLFSFIGFPAGSQPTEDIRKVLLDGNTIQLNRASETTVYSSNNNIKFVFRVINIPTILDVEAKTPYPSDKMEGSWVHGIEHGIFGFSSYLFDTEGINNSRSEIGIEAKTKNGTMILVRQAEYQARVYVSEILSNFIKNLKSNNYIGR